MSAGLCWNAEGSSVAPGFSQSPPSAKNAKGGRPGKLNLLRCKVTHHQRAGRSGIHKIAPVVEAGDCVLLGAESKVGTNREFRSTLGRDKDRVRMRAHINHQPEVV